MALSKIIVYLLQDGCVRAHMHIHIVYSIRTDLVLNWYVNSLSGEALGPHKGFGALGDSGSLFEKHVRSATALEGPSTQVERDTRSQIRCLPFLWGPHTGLLLRELNYHNPETILSIVYPCYRNLV